jgi:hypothetical protein
VKSFQPTTSSSATALAGQIAAEHAAKAMDAVGVKPVPLTEIVGICNLLVCWIDHERFITERDDDAYL